MTFMRPRILVCGQFVLLGLIVLAPASAPGADILHTDFICLPPAAARISW